ncbi:hypothetical protein SAMN00777080_2736 [Aquiflexum balticum DSM 16537]|uniref:Tetratricopeptide repeat-containing protein n=1 Tax=Aquiflexum balticum DSM 16537 TaxID=758820 RepID=A0A1W2H5E6_9BACT|nr:hypothetical protein [Aquiflexum balticum]SMD44121.1 hypothetical protein SAMN00777080_2736 [Aquiflexum balticum DSM 16537]
MGTQVSNPIQQRMDLLLEKWEEATENVDKPLVRIHAEENEKGMIETFHTYLLGTDTGNHDVPIVFDRIFRDEDSFSIGLLKDLNDLISTWNNSNKENLGFEAPPILWTVDFSLRETNNPAYVFIENLNRLSKFLKLGKGKNLVAIFKVTLINLSGFINWLGFILKCEIDPFVKLLIDDTEEEPLFEAFCQKHSSQTITIFPELDMDNAMQQLASMGKPDDPAVNYRKSFVKLMQAISKRNEIEAIKNANECLDIAIENLEKNPYWIGQVIAVYSALANDQIGYKNFQKAIAYASEAVEAAHASGDLIGDEYIEKKFLGQSLMLRGALFTTQKIWDKAIDDFAKSANYYNYTQDHILSIEANRMTAYCYLKNGDRSSACRQLAPTLAIAKHLSAETIQASTFAGVLEILLDSNDQKCVSDHEVEEIGLLYFGKNWMKEIRNWKNTEYAPETEAALT